MATSEQWWNCGNHDDIVYHDLVERLDDDKHECDGSDEDGGNSDHDCDDHNNDDLMTMNVKMMMVAGDDDLDC